MTNGYVISADDTVLPTAARDRIEANIEAVSLSLSLMRADRQPTDEEKDVLVRFSGWGAHKNVLNSAMASGRGTYLEQTPAHTNWEKSYGKYYDRFRELLDDETFEAAEIAALNSHFTSEFVAAQLWQSAIRAGFKGGMVLEPSVGHGMLLGTMPLDLREKVSVFGCDPDPIASRICAQLYPDAQILQSYFEESDLPADMDLAITNVPFSDQINPSNLNVDRLNLHNFVIARSLELLRPGGVGIFITSSATLENRPRDRMALASRGNLVHAVRLPNTAFRASANTEVVTDVLVFEKPQRVSLAVPETFLGKRKVSVAESDAHEYFDPEKGGFYKVLETEVNEYFERNPENLLGRHATNGKMYGGGNSEEGQYSVHPEGDFRLRLAEAMERTPEVVRSVDENLDLEVRTAAATEAAMRRFSSVKIGSYVLDRETGEVTVSGMSSSKPWWTWTDQARSAAKLTFPRGWRGPKIAEAAPALLRLRERFRDQIRLEASGGEEEEIEGNRRLLSEEYNALVEEFGPISKIPLVRIFFGDPDADQIRGLEVMSEVPGDLPGERVEVFEPARILSQRVLSPLPPRPENPTLEEAIVYVRNLTGRIQPRDVADVMGRLDDVETVLLEMQSSEKVFFDPESGEFVMAANYLTSGDLPAKVRMAEERGLVQNVEALRKVLPEMVPFSKIRAPMGSPFVPEEFYRDFAAEVLDTTVAFRFSEGLGEWESYDQRGLGSAARMQFGTDNFDGVELMAKALNGRSPKVYDRVVRSDGSVSSVLNVKATKTAEQKQQTLRKAWMDWVGQDESRRTTIEINYNGLSQKLSVPEYDGRDLMLPGLRKGADALVPRPKQLNATMRFLEEQKGLLAHDVGFGKTLTMIMTAMESKRLGLSQKPMIVCDNASYGSFQEAVRDAYPGAKILCSSKDMMTDRNRGLFLAQVAASDADIVMMQRSHFERLPNDPSEVDRFFDETLAQITAEFEASSGDPKQQRVISKAKERVQNQCRKMRERIEKQVDEGSLTFDQLGIDLLIVDEAHKEKKPFFVTKGDRIKGLDPTASNRATNLLLKARSIQRKRQGRGVILATATPVSNTVAELYNMARICDPEVLSKIGCARFDTFRNTFCEARSEIELHEATGKWKMETRLSKFYNGPLLVKMVRGFADIENNPVDAGIRVPNLNDGGPKMVVTPLSESGFDLMNRISDLYDWYDEMGPDEKREMSHLPLVLMQAAVTGAADPRLIDPNYPDDPLSPGNVAMKMVADTYRRENDRKGVQVIFADRRRSMSLECIGGLSKDAQSKIEVFDGDGSEDTVAGDDDTTESRFDWHADMRDKLIANGVPKEEIVIVSDLKDDPEVRKELMAKLNDGVIRVVIGSTEKVGTGLNFQERLCAAWHLDAPRDFSSAALTQRNGRIIRSGNGYTDVDVFYVGMEDSAMSGVFHRVQRKETMAKQALSGRGVGVEFEDLGSMDLEQMKSCLVSDKRVLHRAELLAEIKDLRDAREMHNDEVVRVTSKISSEMRWLDRAENRLDAADRGKQWAEPRLIPKEIDAKVFVQAELTGVDDSKCSEEEARLEGEVKLDDFRNWMNRAYKVSGHSLDFKLQFAIGPDGDHLTRWTYEYDRKSDYSVTYRLALKSQDWEELPEYVNNGKGVIRYIADRVQSEVDLPGNLRRKIEETKNEIEKLKSNREQLGRFDSSKLDKLEDRLNEVEMDLNENPAKRELRAKGNRSVTIRPVVGNEDQIIDSFVIEVPDDQKADEPSVDSPGDDSSAKLPVEVEVSAIAFAVKAFRVSKL